MRTFSIQVVGFMGKAKIHCSKLHVLMRIFPMDLHVTRVYFMITLTLCSHLMFEQSSLLKIFFSF